MKMSYLIIIVFLISINCQIKDKWNIDNLWEYIKHDISPRQNTTYGLVDPNSLIRTQTTVEFEDYLASLYIKNKMSLFIIVVNQFEDKKLLNESNKLFKYFEEAKFEINPVRLILMVYSVEDKDFKIVVGSDYKLKTNTGIIGDIHNEVKDYIEDKKVFITLITAATKIENFKQLSDADAGDIEEDDEEKPLNPTKDEGKKDVKFNDTSQIFSLYFIIIIIVILLIFVTYFVLKSSKRLRRLNGLHKEYIDYNIMNDQYDN